MNCYRIKGKHIGSLLLGLWICLFAVPSGGSEISQTEIHDQAWEAIMRDDYQKALTLLVPLAGEGFPDARMTLGIMYLEGWGVQQDSQRAVDYLKDYAEAGDPRAQFVMGEAFMEMLPDTRDYFAPVKWWNRAALAGNAAAFGRLSDLRQMYFRFAKKGNPMAMEIGDAYVRYRREEIAAEFPEFQAKQSDDILKTTGILVWKKYGIEKALPVLLREAYSMSIVAHSALRIFYQFRVGDHPAHAPSILNFFETMSDDGSPVSMLFLARVHYHGWGVPRDVEKAIQLAERSGHGAAPEFLEKIKRQSGEISMGMLSSGSEGRPPSFDF